MRATLWELRQKTGNKNDRIKFLAFLAFLAYAAGPSCHTKGGEHEF
jgi:hypothetical protein